MDYSTALLSYVAPAVMGYLIGSIPFAVLVSKFYGLSDPRSHGSGNPGATNVLRTGHKLAALLTLLGDALKGWLAMFLTAKAGGSELSMGIAGLAAFIGHIYPVTLGFRGGKGVATALGVLLGFSGMLAAISAAIWIVVAMVTRYSSLAALITAFVAPFVAWAMSGRLTVTLPITIMSSLLILRHKDNIARLLAGNEGRIGASRK